MQLNHNQSFWRSLRLQEREVSLSCFYIYIYIYTYTYTYTHIHIHIYYMYVYGAIAQQKNYYYHTITFRWTFKQLILVSALYRYALYRPAWDANSSNRMDRLLPLIAVELETVACPTFVDYGFEPMNSNTCSSL